MSQVSWGLMVFQKHQSRWFDAFGQSTCIILSTSNYSISFYQHRPTILSTSVYINCPCIILSTSQSIDSWSTLPPLTTDTLHNRQGAVTPGGLRWSVLPCHQTKSSSPETAAPSAAHCVARPPPHSIRFHSGWPECQTFWQDQLQRTKRITTINFQCFLEFPTISKVVFQILPLLYG